MKRAILGAILAVVLLGCDDDDGHSKPTVTPTATATPTATLTATATLTPTPTPISTATATASSTPIRGPEITFFGLTRADDSLLPPHGAADDGTPIYIRVPGATGLASGFVLVVEGKPGASGAEVGSSSYDPTGASFPDLVIQVTHPLGDGSSTICDDPQVAPGGVPATFPVSFDATAENIAAANDFGCRFSNGGGQHRARTNSGDSCVNFNGTFNFVAPTTRAQFCGFVNVPLGFPPGDTTVTTRLRDSEGNWGAPAQIIIRVP